jgi:hypothetical protein
MGGEGLNPYDMPADDDFAAETTACSGIYDDDSTYSDEESALDSEEEDGRLLPWSSWSDY